MAAELKKQFDVDAELIEGSKGIYDIHVDGQLVYSKYAEDDRFPEDGEVESRIRDRQKK